MRTEIYAELNEDAVLYVVYYKRWYQLRWRRCELLSYKKHFSLKDAIKAANNRQLKEWPHRSCKWN